MCTIAALFARHPQVPLFVAANRDELYARPASGPFVLHESPHIVGGRDDQAGGTWLGIRADGVVAAITNQRSFAAAGPAKRSRGAAVMEVLIAADPHAAARALDPHDFNSGNLLVGDADRLTAIYLRRDAGTADAESLPPGLHVLANDRLGSPEFPRAVRLSELVEPIALRPLEELVTATPHLLADHQPPPDHLVVDPPPGTMFTRELISQLGRVCIHTPQYGTRWATVAALGHGEVLHYSYAPGPPCVTPMIDATLLARGV
jgi:uncharacterized protein with NRDE domain